MSMASYVPPEQLMRDRAEFARKGISRGRSVVVVSCAAGIALVAENPSPSLHKVSEIYDRIGFAAVGRYNEFEALRIAGIRQADLRGYSYDRRDVTARALAGSYSQQLGAVFASGDKPFEVELVVAELGSGPADDLLFHVSYDGTIGERSPVAVLGRDAAGIARQVTETVADQRDLPGVVRLAREALAGGQPEAEPALEVAVLERGCGRRRTFRRIRDEQLDQWLRAEA